MITAVVIITTKTIKHKPPSGRGLYLWRDFLSLYSKTTVQEILKKYNAAALKSLGQNFLIDQNVVSNIAGAAVQPYENVLEIGPGMGALTKALGQTAKKVVAVEIDKGMVEILKETLADAKNVFVEHADFLKVDLADLSKTHFNGEPFVVAGNLPYYITAKCILKVLGTEEGLVRRVTAMVQKEVAERLAAQPGNKIYGALTASVAYYGQMKQLFTVSPTCFYPQPDVQSAIVQIVPTPQVEVPREKYERVVRALFAMRRKTVLNNLKAGLSLSNEQANAVLKTAEIAPSARAETLSLIDFAKLAAVLEQ